MPRYRLDDMEQKEPVPGYRLRAVHGERMTVAYWEIDPEAVMPEHSHPQEQVATLLEGEFELTVDGETHVLGPGAVVVIASGALHSGRAVTACRMMDAFHPPRDEWR